MKVCVQCRITWGVARIWFIWFLLETDIKKEVLQFCRYNCSVRVLKAAIFWPRLPRPYSSMQKANEKSGFWAPEDKAGHVVAFADPVFGRSESCARCLQFISDLSNDWNNSVCNWSEMSKCGTSKNSFCFSMTLWHKVLRVSYHLKDKSKLRFLLICIFSIEIIFFHTSLPLALFPGLGCAVGCAQPWIDSWNRKVPKPIEVTSYTLQSWQMTLSW